MSMLNERLKRVVLICVTIAFIGIVLNAVYIMRHKKEIVYSPFEKKTQESQLDTLMDKMETNLMDKRPSDKRVPENRTSDTKPEIRLEPQTLVKQQDINPTPSTSLIPNERKFVKMNFGHVYIFGAVTGNSSNEKTLDLVKIYGNFEKKTFAQSSLYCCLRYNYGAKKLIRRVTPLVKRRFQSAADMWSYYLACPNTNNLNELNMTLFGYKDVVAGHSIESQTMPPLMPDDNIAIDTKTLSEVAVTVDSYSCEEKDVTYVKPFQPLKTPGKIAIGTKTAFGSINPEQIIEWMETYKYIGVDKIVSYYMKILNADALKVLKYYESTGYLDLTFYEPAAEETYPRLSVFATQTSQTWNDQQVVVDDSFERMSGYQYFGIIDHDEFFIPSNNRRLKQVLVNNVKTNFVSYTMYQRELVMPRLHLPQSSYDLFVFEIPYDFFGIVCGYKLRRCVYIAFDHLAISFGDNLGQNLTETLQISYNNHKEILSEKHPLASGYRLSSQYYYLSWGRSLNQTDMFLGRYTTREERAPRPERVKNIYTPSRVALGGVDTHVIKPAKGFKMHSVPPAMGYIRHFRACRKSNLKQCMNETDTPRVVDTEVAEWSTKIAASVANVRKKVLGI